MQVPNEFWTKKSDLSGQKRFVGLKRTSGSNAISKKSAFYSNFAEITEFKDILGCRGMQVPDFFAKTFGGNQSKRP